MNEDHTRKCFEFLNGVKKYYLDIIYEGVAALPLCFVLICCVCSLLSSAQSTLGLIYSHSPGIVLTLHKKRVCMQNHCCIYETWILFCSHHHE